MASEFGAGIVVCLAKFSEHLQEHGPFSEQDIVTFAKMTDKQLENLRAQAEHYPNGDAAAQLAKIQIFFILGSGYEDKEAVVSHLIEMWMNAASDHFYDLDVEWAEKYAPALVQLRNLTLKIGHGFSGNKWTLETIDKIRELWKKSCMQVDRALGTKPDWGQW